MNIFRLSWLTVYIVVVFGSHIYMGLLSGGMVLVNILYSGYLVGSFVAREF